MISSTDTEPPKATMARATRGTVSPGLARVLAGLALVATTAAAAAFLDRFTDALPHWLPDYATWQAGAYSQAGDFLHWWIGDTSEAQFYKSGIGSLGMLAGAWIAHVAWKRGRRWAGFPISYGTGLWPWLLASALLGLLLSDLAWGWTLPATGA